MSTKSQISENIEPSTETVEVFENAGDHERREWAEAGADWAHFIVQFLRGRRRLDIQPSEIVKTQLYERSNDLEKRALRMVCEVEKEIPPSPEDERRLRSRDQFLVDYVEGLNLGHADLVAQIRLIPAKVAERQQWDRTFFAKVWESPRLFEFVWKR